MAVLVDRLMGLIAGTSDAGKTLALRLYAALPRRLRCAIARRIVAHRTKELGRGTGPRSLFFFVTRRCNLRCAHCFYKAELGAGVGELTMEEIRRAAQSVKGELSSVSLTGGEPLLRSDLTQIVSAFADIGCLDVSLATNGTIGDPAGLAVEVLHRHPSLNLAVQISLDGPAEVHDRIRAQTGAFAKALESLHKLAVLSEREPRLKVLTNTVVTKMNASVFVDFITELRRDRRISCMWHFLRQDHKDVHGIDREALLDAGGSDDMLPAESICRQIMRQMYILDGAGALGAWRLLEKDYHLQIAREGKQAVRCVEPQVGAVLFSNGDVSLCEVLKPVTNIRSHQGDLMQAWRSPELDRQRKLACRCYCTYPCGLMHSMQFDTATFEKAVSWTAHPPDWLKTGPS